MDKITPGNHYRITYEFENTKVAGWGHYDYRTVSALCIKKSKIHQFSSMLYTFWTPDVGRLQIFHKDIDEAKQLPQQSPLGEILYG